MTRKQLFKELNKQGESKSLGKGRQTPQGPKNNEVLHYDVGYKERREMKRWVGRT